MTRPDALHRHPNLSSRLPAWLASALLLAGCYDPAGMLDEGSSSDDGSTGGDASSSGDASSAGTNPMTSATTSDDESGSVDEDSSGGSSSAQDDDSSSGESTDEGESSTGDVPDTTAPTILSISPADGEAGVASDVDIVITFDEPMDTTATAAAFGSASIGAFSASWSEGDTVLTVAPDAALAYANGTDPDDVIALEYAFTIGVDATDAAGNALASELGASFTTSRRITTTLVSDAALTGAVLANGTLNVGAGGDALAGDGTDNVQRIGFFALVLGDLPSGTEVESASLDAQQHLTLGAPFTTLGSLGIEHITADALDGDAFDVAALADLGVFSASANDGARTADITSAVATDLAAGRARSQYRVQFASATDGDGSTDRTRFDEPGGSIVYLLE